MDNQKAWKLRKKYGCVRKKIRQEYRNIIQNGPSYIHGNEFRNSSNQVEFQENVSSIVTSNNSLMRVKSDKTVGA